MALMLVVWNDKPTEWRAQLAESSKIIRKAVMRNVPTPVTGGPNPLKIFGYDRRR